MPNIELWDYTNNSDEHWQNVHHEVRCLLEEIPLYRSYNIKPLDKNSSAEAIAKWLSEIPVLTKKEIRMRFPDNIMRETQNLKHALVNKDVEMVSTSGSTGEAMQVILNSGWWDRHLLEGMALNQHAKEIISKEKPSEVILTTPVCSNTDCHLDPSFSKVENRTVDGVLYLNRGTDPAHWSEDEFVRIINEWNDKKPDWVEADPAYLAILCSYVKRNSIKLHSPSFITLTYELTTRAHKKIIQSTLDTQLYQMYGSTEAGILFMECTKGLYHHNAKHSHIELIKMPNGLARPLVTTIGRSWMPLLRYDIGDIVRVSHKTQCDCGLPSNGYLLERIDGRLPDTFEHNNQLITPAILDELVFTAEPDLDAWQLILVKGNQHHQKHTSTLRVVGGEGHQAARALEIALDRTITPIKVKALQPELSGKYKLVRYEEGV